MPVTAGDKLEELDAMDELDERLALVRQTEIDTRPGDGEDVPTP